VLDSLRSGNPDIAKDAKCHKVVFTPVTIVYYQKRQIDATGNSSENSTQGVQASSEIQLVSSNATELNQTEFNNILLTGYNQVNSSSELHLSNVETNVVIPDSTTTVQLTQTSIQTQFDEITTNQHVISTESQTPTELSKFSSLGVHSDSTSIPPVTDITHPTQSDQTTSTSHLIDTTPTISTTAFQSTESTTLQTPVSTPVSTSQHTPESTSQPSPQSTLMQTAVHSDSTSIPPVTDITHPTQSDQTTSTSHLIDTTPTISTTAFQSTESTTLQTPVSTPVSTSQHTPESTSQPSPQSTLMQTGSTMKYLLKFSLILNSHAYADQINVLDICTLTHLFPNTQSGKRWQAHLHTELVW
ncbi:unnamed protein product, partial [Schistosoma margrebowiei]